MSIPVHDANNAKLLEKIEQDLWQIICELRHANVILGNIEILLESNRVTNFTPIQEINMVPLAAGQTATFATTPIPATSVPTPSGIQWSSSDTTNAPVTPNTADSTGLSVLVTFPSTVAAGVTFALTVTYTNSDGSVATQTNSFTTVAPASPDVTGFTPITQTA